MKPEFLSTSEARKQLSSLVNQVKYQKKEFAIGRHGHSEAYLVPSMSNVPLSQSIVQDSDTALSKLTHNALKKIAKQYQLALVILFGSHAKGTAKPTSDLDIAIMPEGDFSPSDEQKLYDELAKIFHREDIDLVNLKTAHHILLEYEILTNGKVLYKKNRDIFVKQRMKAYFDYQDFKNYFNQQKKALLNKLDNLTY